MLMHAYIVCVFTDPSLFSHTGFCMKSSRYRSCLAHNFVNNVYGLHCHTFHHSCVHVSIDCLRQSSFDPVAILHNKSCWKTFICQNSWSTHNHLCKAVVVDLFMHFFSYIWAIQNVVKILGRQVDILLFLADVLCPFQFPPPAFGLKLRMRW